MLWFLQACCAAEQKEASWRKIAAPPLCLFHMQGAMRLSNVMYVVLLQARRAAEREEARRRQIAAKEGFMALLEDTAWQLIVLT
jgi:hypothetical protein